MLIMGIPVLATIGMMGISLWFLIILCLIPLGFGVIFQLILTAITEHRGLLFAPAGIGLIGFILSLIFLGSDLPVFTFIVYWLIYFLAIWLTWFIVCKLKCYFAGRWKRSE